MKKSTFYLTLSLLFSSVLANAQFNYQAIVRDASGLPLLNQNVGIKFSIDNINQNGMEYEETFHQSTNQFGLINLVVGSGTVVTGSWNSIEWSQGAVTLSVGIDASGGTNYTAVSSGDFFKKVPFAEASTYCDSLRLPLSYANYLPLATTPIGATHSSLVKSAIYQKPITNGIMIGDASTPGASANDLFRLRVDGTNVLGNSLLLMSNTQENYLRFKSITNYNSDADFVGYLASKTTGITPNFELSTDVSNANGNLVLGTRTNPLMYFRPDGNVSIGTNIPGAKLSIEGPGDYSTAQLRVQSNNSSNPDVFIALSNAFGSTQGYGLLGLHTGLFSQQGLAFHNYDMGEMGRFNYYGNFGIGTQDPKARLHIKSASQASPSIIPNALLEEQSPGESTKLMFRNSASTINNWCISALPGTSGANSTMNFYSNHGNNVLTLKGDGAIQFNGTLQPGGNPGNTGDVLVSGGSGAAPYWQNAGSLGGSWTTSGNDIHNANLGNVGIGTSAPTANLDVNGIMRLGLRYTSVQPISAGVSAITLNDNDNVLIINNSFSENFTLTGFISANATFGRIITLINNTGKAMTLKSNSNQVSGAQQFLLPSNSDITTNTLYLSKTFIAVDDSQGGALWQVLD